MEFWSELITKKSWEILLKFKKEPIKFIVIGGWADYLWTKLHKSKDIDIAITDLKDLDYLKNKYDLKKKDRLNKYEIIIDEIDIDIYVPYYSKLAIPVEDLDKYTSIIENLKVVLPHALLILKQGAELDRKDTVKGLKDQIDIMTLLMYSEVDFKEYDKLLKKYKLEEFRKRLKFIINNFKDLKYIGLNPREFKLKKRELLEKI